MGCLVYVYAYVSVSMCLCVCGKRWHPVPFALNGSGSPEGLGSWCGCFSLQDVVESEDAHDLPLDPKNECPYLPGLFN